MIGAIIELIKRTVERGEKSRCLSVRLADSYLLRISRFQDQLALLGVALNSAAAGFALKAPAGYSHELTPFIIGSLLVFLANMLLAKLYSNGHLTTKLLFAGYPELELVRPGDKSWSNFKVLTRAYLYVQAGWLLYAAFMSYLLIRCMLASCA